MTRMGQFRPAWPQSTLFYTHGSSGGGDLAEGNSQQDKVSTGKKSESGSSQGSSKAGRDGEKENRKEKVVEKRNADSEKESEGGKGAGRKKNKQAKLYWLGNMNTICK